MVLMQSYGHSPAPQRPNSARVTGLSLAIALNASVLLALSVLMKPPLFLEPVSTSIEVVDLKPKATPTPPPPPERVPVTRSQDTPPPRPAPSQRTAAPDAKPQPIATGPVIDPAPSNFTLPDAGGSPDPAPPAGPIAGIRLEYGSAPPPRYTAALIRERAEGTVMLQVLVDLDGRPLEVTVHRSSGNRQLDRLAQQHVLDKWTFRPATRDGRAVQAIGLVPIDFRLD